MHHPHRRIVWILSASLVLLALGMGYGYYRYRALVALSQNQGQAIGELRTTIQELEDNLSLTEYERDRLTSVLSETEARAGTLETQATTLSSQVTTLEKLTTIDPELLKKYSKVYFLNEHYVPTRLSDIPYEYLSVSGRTLQFHTQALPYLEALLTAATQEGLALRIASAYRSFDTQESIKSSNKITYGTTAANRFSADQGYSEHQLGTTVDLTTAKTGTLSTLFEKTKEFQWLTQHAHKYGFVLSYPKNNKYYIYEPWHWRFVGVRLATTLHQNNTYLYDMDQRTIDEYLLTIFD